MECPGCKTEVKADELKIEQNAEEDGFEVNYHCQVCEVDYFAILTPEVFLEVD